MTSDESEQANELRSRVTTTFESSASWLPDWRPGFALPSRFTATIEGDWLAFRVRLDLVANEHRVQAVGVALEAREEATPVTARALRDVPLGELIRLATSAALRPMERKPGELTIQLGGGGKAEPMELVSPGRQRRVSRRTLEETARIYLGAESNPTAAVEREHSQGPISYSTAARWVEDARRLGLIPPTTPGKATTT